MLKKALVLGVAGALLAVAGTASAVDGPDRTVVRTDAGPVRGKVTDEVRTFEGVPYAAPPTGELRWRSPHPVRPWTGVRDATAPASACPQNDNPEAPGGSTNEDCLYVNVTTPVKPSARPRPVVVWIPGGGFFMGAGHNYDAHRLAARGDAVVVTMNYRLGIFGFFGHDGLPGSGTFGLQDQQAALRWVQRNAAAFGGDAGNVTLAGESAGGMSTCAQLTSPGSAGLFQRAVMQSGSCDFDWPTGGQYPGQRAGSFWVPQRAIRQQGDEIAAKELGCPGGAAALACLRGRPPAELMKQFMAFTSSGTGSGVLPENPATALAAGRFHRVPVLSGNNHDEGRSWLQAFGAIDAAKYHQLVAAMAGDAAAKVEAEYPLSAYASPAHAWGAVTTDRIWSCNQVRSDRALSSKVPTYAYEFSDAHSPLVRVFPGPIKEGAMHGVELPYLFDIRGAHLELAPDQRALADEMVDYWAAFARTGDPNGPGRPHWAPVSGAVSGPSLKPSGQGGIATVDLAAEHHCGMWAGPR
ncbi:carboxylesterase/lipase family protein [Amycolatopsis sp. CA-230715]|uniref:carboxylesterase/lipase family protein n=1 Tax=Amycolatopsis sp. CA-230715 TaxID=2745196 RepID=UPI001C038D0B|nr:carboxylesterase family protein [Amycolatopsis sp. CA-230715]QWF78444.1 Para-nitrobenzyl esterase [Amycolatopsis sp. CA-230715]